LDYPKTALEALLTPYATKFPPPIQSVYIQAIPKVFVVWATETTSTWTQEKKFEVEFLVEQVLQWLDNFRYSTDLEVQERAVGFSQIFTKVQSEIRDAMVPEPRTYQDEATESWDTSRPMTQFPIITQLRDLFGGTELNPVAAKAQRRVPIPDGLDLTTPLYTTKQIIQWPSSSLEEDEPPKIRVPATAIPSESKRQQYLDRIRDDPFYIASDRPRTPLSAEEEDFDAIPIVQFDGGTNLLTPITSTKVKKKKKKAREVVLEEPVDIAVDEMPDNATPEPDALANGKRGLGGRGENVLRSSSGKALEDIDFEEEERAEREALEAEGAGRYPGRTRVEEEEMVVEEPLVVEKVRKKKKRKEGEASKKVKKKKEKSVEAVIE
jgi:AP-3 complex subunit delta